MEKKRKSSLGYLYFLGMVLVVVGFCCPLFRILDSPNGFKLIDFGMSKFVAIGALFIFIGAIAGAVIVALNFAAIKVPSANLLKLLALVVSLVGGIVLVVGFNHNAVYKTIAKGLIKHAQSGFYMILAGWVVGILGFLTNK